MTHLAAATREPLGELPAYTLAIGDRVLVAGVEAQLVARNRRSWSPSPSYRIDRADLGRRWYRAHELERIDS
jgi:hypothetical protein